MGRGSRAFRRKAHVDNVFDVDPVEFAELLDPITPIPEQVEFVDEPIEDEMPIVSRFVEAGIDDDRLPLPAAKRRLLRR